MSLLREWFDKTQRRMTTERLQGTLELSSGLQIDMLHKLH